jgi:hypothetical protein
MAREGMKFLLPSDRQSMSQNIQRAHVWSLQKYGNGIYVSACK